MSTSCIPDPSVCLGVTLGVCATLQLLAKVQAGVDMPYHLPSLFGRLVGCPEEVSLARLPVVLRNLFHWSQAPPGVREMSSFYPGANHLMDIYLTRPSKSVVSPRCPTQELLAMILGMLACEPQASWPAP